MIGTIEEIIDNTVIIKLAIDITKQPNLINLHIIFEDDANRKIVAEISNINETKMTAILVGEIFNEKFLPGSNTKPSFKSKIRLITKEELELLYGKQEIEQGYTNFGTSNVYQNYRINVAINSFFGGHFCIIGNSGSGKSCGVASILQKLYTGVNEPPTKSSFFFFDAYGEYSRAFSNLHEKNPKLNYKSYTTNIRDKTSEILRIPIWLLDVEDLSLLLEVESIAQLPIIEKTLKLVPILTATSDNVIKRKNDIIARAIQEIMLGGNDSTTIRDQVIGILTKFNTPTLKLDSAIVQPGYTRSLKQCLFVDNTGKMQEMELVVEFIRSHIMQNEEELSDEELNHFYSLKDLEMAMDFALVSEGTLKSEKAYDTNNAISIRLHSLATGDNRHYFSYQKYVTRDEYIDELLFNKSTNAYSQIVNFNINYIDDRMARNITKIISKMLFNKMAELHPRASRAFHIVMEEAHRYIQKDQISSIFGYNIFERIAKEGRKYGLFLGLISQRPSELSDTCISQCSNFLIFRIIHPDDLKYIQEMLSNVSQEMLSQLKNLKPGNCIAFGSAFKVPTIMYVSLPDPLPLSDDVDLMTVWYDNKEERVTNTSDVYTIMKEEVQNQKFMISNESNQQVSMERPVLIQNNGQTQLSNQMPRFLSQQE